MREEFVNTGFDTCKNMMNTNCMSHIALTKGFLPRMISQESGHIVNIISISGIMGIPVRTLYCASKYAMDGFSKSLRAEVAQYNIKVTGVYPSYVQTNISKNATTGTGKAFGKLDDNIKKGIPVDVAVNQILRAIALGRSDIILGNLGYQIIPSICFMSSTIMDYMNKFLYKRQLKVMAKAK